MLKKYIVPVHVCEAITVCTTGEYSYEWSNASILSYEYHFPILHQYSSCKALSMCGSYQHWVMYNFITQWSWYSEYTNNHEITIFSKWQTSTSTAYKVFIIYFKVFCWINHCMSLSQWHIDPHNLPDLPLPDPISYHKIQYVISKDQDLDKEFLCWFEIWQVALQSHLSNFKPEQKYPPTLWFQILWNLTLQKLLAFWNGSQGPKSISIPWCNGISLMPINCTGH